MSFDPFASWSPFRIPMVTVSPAASLASYTYFHTPLSDDRESSASDGPIRKTRNTCVPVVGWPRDGRLFRPGTGTGAPPSRACEHAPPPAYKPTSQRSSSQFRPCQAQRAPPQRRPPVSELRDRRRAGRPFRHFIVYCKDKYWNPRDWSSATQLFDQDVPEVDDDQPLHLTLIPATSGGNVWGKKAYSVHLQADRHRNKDGDLFITIKDCGSAQDPAGWDSAIDRSDVFAPPQWSVGSHDYDCSNADSTWWYDLGYYSTLPLGRPRVEGPQTRRHILLGTEWT